ncbi:histone-binding protein N1/N2-like isoform X4 [Betta splendens]|uniref:Histone-binding protein N1/N2-like isoform X4 n=1 Tax=Betta splendens TaxID=158456 RepID=A0A9W2XDY5_BETSP|nr:histone-binding protein N1/N2-like isoform X4 [Betta splendens]
MEETDKLIGAGKKHLVMGKVVEAVSSLQEACGMLAKKYGDTADECGEAFFWCGKALLDLARMENSVLGNALEGVPEEDDDNRPNDSKIESTENIDEKTRDELRDQVYDAMAEKEAEDKEAEGKESDDAGKVEGKDSDHKEEAEEKEKVDGKESGHKEEAEEKEKVDGKESGDAEKVEGKPSKGAEQTDVEKAEAGGEQKNTEEEAEEEKMAEGDEKNSDINDTKSGEQEDESADQQDEVQDDEEGEEDEMETEDQGEADGTAEKDSEDEEVGNLQLAWEMLEVAKVIYKRKETKEDQLMAAQAHLKLGEVSTESGNYTQALDDFQECLKLQQKHLDSDSRLLAETHYQLGLTYSLNLEFNKAIEELNNSISVIKSRLDKLQELLEKSDCPDALPDERKEMEELKALLPEIQEKVEDATEGQKTASNATQAVKDVLDGDATSGSSLHNSGLSTSNTNSTTTNGDSTTNGEASSAPVSDISHLVRKKRKPEESPLKEGVVKKVRQDDAIVEQEPHTNGIDKATSDTKDMEVESQ